ncbi:MAG: FAD-dependent oxidoreductase, partial [Planctomycetes bacterium]|nr:FAD-dependent oxidoreductase [Planctomycetota bacterium]
DLLAADPPPASPALASGDALSGGDPRVMIDAAHRIRIGEFEGCDLASAETGETYDLVVVGGGVSGLAAAHFFRLAAPSRAAGPAPTVLVLDGHSEPGGNARGELFDIDGRRGTAPTGSAYVEGLSQDEFGELARGLDVDEDLMTMPGPDDVWFFDPPAAGRAPSWLVSPWGRPAADLPLPAADAAELAAWTREVTTFWKSPLARREAALERVTYKQYLTQEKRWTGPALAWADCHSADVFGVTAEAVSARAAFYFLGGEGEQHSIRSLPGGNGAFSRLLVRALVPDAIAARAPLGVAAAPIDRARLDVAGAPARIRLDALVVRVQHDGPPDAAEQVSVHYLHGGTLHRVRARAVVVACGAYTARRICPDLSEERVAELRRFQYAAYLVANVAVRHSRMLDAAGIGYTGYAAGGFGTSFTVGDRPGMKPAARPAPSRPNVITLYAPRRYSGMTGDEQGKAGRTELYTTPFAVYEKQVLDDLARLLGPWGFDPARDVAGITLYRWGHAMVIPYPGFSHPVNGEGDPPCATATRPLGRIAFAHTDRGGMPYIESSVAHARAAVDELLRVVK